MLPNELTTLQVFRGLEEDDAARICERLLYREYAPGESILTEGDDTQALWLVLSGECNSPSLAASSFRRLARIAG